jgi:hypothetical protein
MKRDPHSIVYSSIGGDIIRLRRTGAGLPWCAKMFHIRRFNGYNFAFATLNY